PADSIPKAKWHASIAPSTASSLLRMNARAAFSLAFSLASTVAAVSPCSPASPGWTATPSRAAAASCASLSGRRGGFADRARGASASKKKSRDSEDPQGVARRHGGRGPGFRPEVDASVAPQAAPGAAPARASIGAQYDRSAAARAGLLPEDVP